ncbi:MAG: hypothetical protein ABIU18_08990 [Novosphingobium sp.]
MKLFVARALAIPIAWLAAAAPAQADDVIPPVVGGNTWIQHQIVAAKAHHPQILAIKVEGVRPGSPQVLVLGSTASPSQLFHPVAHPVTEASSSRVGGRYIVRRPLINAMKNRLGTITFTFAKGGPAADAAADAVASDIALHTLSSKNAVDPYPYDAAFSTHTYGQKLVDAFTRKYPELIVMMLHATPPGKSTNVIIGSNIGRIGKIADEDDLRVIEQGSTNLEVSDTRDRFETEVPLNDATGKRIGALGLVFPYHEGADKEAIHARGKAIRDKLAKQIPSSAALFEIKR